MQPTALFPAEHSVLAWFHRPAPDETLEATLAPEYWAHVAHQLQPGNRIEMLWADGSLWAHLIVRAAHKGSALVQCLQFVRLGQEASAALEDLSYEVKWRGPKALWGVVRKADNAVLQDKFTLREQAEEWLLDHMKAMAA